MKIQPGQILLHYRIVDKVGEGGMGEVWRAVDTTLDREVAIKILPPEFGSDPERLARFEREAKTLASLSHPNIATIHGLHTDHGVRFLAMELVPGTNLRARIERGRLSVEEAVGCATQVAVALESAHEQGIVHRDLKPANVMLGPDGAVKVLDFGLAKIVGSEESSGGDASASPTITSLGTQAGTLLGTAAYMSPEQARGQHVDRRADIWAFGCVLYEMLTGSRTFDGGTISDTLAAVLRADVDLDRLPDATPVNVRTLLKRCLDRDPQQRLRDIGEARIALQRPIDTLTETPPTPGAPRSWMTIGLLLIGIAATAGLAGWWLAPAPKAPTRRLSLAPPPGISGSRTGAVISPDGRRITYIADGQLWIQDLDSLTARSVTGGADSLHVCWSPDSGDIAFAVRDEIWRANTAGDSRLVGKIPTGVGTRGGALAWTADGTFVYSVGEDDIFELPVSGGKPRSILSPDTTAGEVDFHTPSTLPDGRGVLYIVHRATGMDTIELLRDGRRIIVFRDEGASFTSQTYSPTGHVLFVRRGEREGVWAVPFSMSEGTATGDAFLVSASGGHPSVSKDGTLLFGGVSELGDSELVYLDRQGEIVGRLGDSVQHADNIRISPDGKTLGVCISEGSDTNLWAYDLSSGSRIRLAFKANCGGRTGDIAWSPDSKMIAFGDTEKGTVRALAVDGSAEERTVVEGLMPEFTRDGEQVIFVRQSEETGPDIWIAPLDGSEEPAVLVDSPGADELPRLSPDGNLLAYTSNETGRFEVYVRSFPSGTGRWQVSNDGGNFPRWSSAGDRLFYLRDESALIEVPINAGAALRFGEAVELLKTTAQRIGMTHGYDVEIGGERFLTMQFEQQTSGRGNLTLVTNWNSTIEGPGF
jgi:Tol biopolymer transport system component/tRNA A-37 threonylcarbamoyl transferase component Bud32